jgi:hypothetical protein
VKTETIDSMFEGNIRAEVIIHLATMLAQDLFPPVATEAFMEEDPEPLWESIGIEPPYDLDDPGLIFDHLMDNEKSGFLVKFSTPVPQNIKADESHRMSWAITPQSGSMPTPIKKPVKNLWNGVISSLNRSAKRHRRWLVISVSRKDFEKCFSVPKGVFWNDASEQYDALPGAAGFDEVKIYHGKWMGWQASRHGLKSSSFQMGIDYSKAFILTKQAEAVHKLVLKLGIYCETDPMDLIEEEVERLRNEANKEQDR